MLKKYSPATKIAFAAFVTSISGFLAQTLGYRSGSLVAIISEGFYTINLQWPGGHSVNDIVRVNQVFYLLLLLGAILYVSSGQKETRLVRFGFSLIFLSCAVSVFIAITSSIAIGDEAFPGGNHFLGDLYFYVLQAVWLWLSYSILKYFNQVKLVDKTEIQYDSMVYNDYSIASLWQRFFHLMIDTFIGVMLFYRAIDYWLDVAGFRKLLLHMQDIFGERLSLIILVALLRLVYYQLSEGLFSTTPAKLLTETRVITETGDRPGAGTIIGRTISRVVPFEAFSFFGARGWHDKWSVTQVAKEVPTGANGRRYFLIIPLFIGLIMIISAIESAYRESLYRQMEQKQSLVQKTALEDDFNKLSTNSFLQLYNDNGSDFSTIFLKVEEFGTNNIRLAMVAPEPGHTPTQPNLEKAYKLNKSALPQYYFTRNDLRNALKPEGGQFTGKRLVISGRQYTIKKIETYFMPNIGIAMSNTYGTYFTYGLYNSGWKTDLTVINVVEGDIKILNTLPLHIKSPQGNVSSTVFMLNCTTVKPAANFKINLTFADTTGQMQVYQITGDGQGISERKIVRLR